MRTIVDQAQNEGVYLAVAVDITVTSNVEKLQTCVYEDHPVSVFYSSSDKVDLSPSKPTVTHSIIQDSSGLHFGIQVNDIIGEAIRILTQVSGLIMLEWKSSSQMQVLAITELKRVGAIVVHQTQEMCLN